jgi:hypothetical protein
MFFPKNILAHILRLNSIVGEGTTEQSSLHWAQAQVHDLML